MLCTWTKVLPRIREVSLMVIQLNNQGQTSKMTLHCVFSTEPVGKKISTLGSEHFISSPVTISLKIVLFDRASWNDGLCIFQNWISFFSSCKKILKIDACPLTIWCCCRTENLCSDLLYIWIIISSWNASRFFYTEKYRKFYTLPMVHKIHCFYKDKNV